MPRFSSKTCNIVIFKHFRYFDEIVLMYRYSMGTVIDTYKRSFKKLNWALYYIVSFVETV